MRSLIISSIALLTLAGCLPRPALDHKQSEEPAGVAMGQAAPVFEGDMSKFAVGKWSPHKGTTISPEMAKQMGVGSVNDGGEVDTDRVWTFREDGTFTYQVKGADSMLEGKWTSVPDGISLQYLTFDGQSVEAAKDKIESQSGFAKVTGLGRATLSEDKKRFYFAIGSGSPDPGMNDFGGMGRMVLERIK